MGEVFKSNGWHIVSPKYMSAIVVTAAVIVIWEQNMMRLSEISEKSWKIEHKGEVIKWLFFA